MPASPARGGGGGTGHLTLPGVFQRERGPVAGGGQPAAEARPAAEGRQQGARRAPGGTSWVPPSAGLTVPFRPQLIQFLISLVQSNRILGVKRKM